ncbi:DNA recombination protein RmuC [Bizionia sediminis]|uniref:DNA recombination protein RmuC n=1 Tax=Bizionia sediminis TaxID=1737064 RepID=A0ABW5KSB5_9FLAO
MTDSVFLILVSLITGTFGAFVGFSMAKLRHKGDSNTLQERNTNLQQQLTTLQANFQNDLKRHESFFNQQLSDYKTTIGKLEDEQYKLRQEKEHLQTALAKRNSDFDNLEEQLVKQEANVLEQQTQMRKDFELLASKILDEKSEKFTSQNKENIKQILHPLQEKIQLFEKKVEDTQKESISMHSALKEQLLGLKDLNQQMTKEATNLTRALKGDSKMQGNWGELVLERVLEKSGLEKNREYFVQQSFTTTNQTRLLPDVVLHLPNNKRMIIDSKVSLTDYERLVNAEDTDKPAWLKAHVNSIKRHVDQLSDKKYEDLYDIESPDFVLMFIPIEPAFAIALNEDNTLYNKAFEKNIVIVTPTTLLATLRTIDSMWSTEKQQRNALEIAKQAGALYDKFEGLITDLTNVGKKLDLAKTDYAAAMNKLVDGKGNIIGRIEKLKKMGAKAKKSLPEAIVQRATGDENTL